MAELKPALFEYLAHRHFDLMPSDVHDRFEEYDSNGSLIGNMKEWKNRFEGKPLLDLALDPGDWEKLYDACQQTFQEMDDNKTHEYAYGSDYNGATKEFIGRWFGDNSKTFTKSKATSDTDTVLKNLGIFLENNPRLKPYFSTHLPSVFGDSTAYEKFYKDLKKGKFNDNFEFRQKVQSVIEYIKAYGPQEGSDEEPDVSLWPGGIGYSMVGGHVSIDKPELQAIHGLGPAPHLNPDPDKWYVIPDKNDHITQFKTDYKNIFDTLLTDATIRKHFLAKAKSPVQEVLETAIAKTDYENKESDDYLPPKPLDEQNWRQKITKWKDDTYENHFRRFFEHGRGTRKYFSQYTQNIMKGFDKAGIKPTDGLDGILSKKDDSKLRSAIDKDPTTRKHFDWFIKSMERIKKEMPDAFSAALSNGNQLREIVIRLISTTKPEDVEKAKTALEILSTAKYGLLCSRTFNKFRDATKNAKFLNDPGYSWMKKGDSATAFIANAANGLLTSGMNMLAGTATVAYNFIQHRRTKISNDLKKHKNLNAAYKKWETEDAKRHADLIASNAAHNVAGTLTDLDNPARTPGVAPYDKYKTTIQINNTTIEAIKTAIQTERDAGKTDTDPLPGYGFTIGEAQNDVDLFDDAYTRQRHEDKWREENPDVMSDLAAHWNLMESYMKTHALGLGSMKIKRDAMFEVEAINGKTHAVNVADAYRKKFGKLRAA
jgi:hypothetical protein